MSPPITDIQLWIKTFGYYFRRLTRRTTSTFGLPTALPVQETWEHIIQSVESSSDLRSCALVSRASVQAAQSLIFETVNFPERSSSRKRPWTRLRDRVKESPHLLHYIRSIIVHDPTALPFICSLRLPRLRGALLSRETVRRVEIWGLITNVDWIPTLLQEVGPQLQTLEVHSNGDYDRPSIRHQPRTQAEPIILSKLALGNDRRVTQWLLRASDMFDFTHLTEFEMFEVDTNVAQLLHGSRCTIRRLSFPYAEHLIQKPNLKQFPMLDDLQMKWNKPYYNKVAPALADIIPALVALDLPESIRSIKFTFIGRLRWSEGGDDMIRAFTALAAISLPVLEELRVDLVTRSEGRRWRTYRFARTESPPALAFKCTAGVVKS
ncbi:hypothetical protein DFH09DRAFT_1373502 [Mycena vulgaris]|nr:hypothetical protein DFH09DRAFT_1373502 [Mycena vulgaris]